MPGKMLVRSAPIFRPDAKTDIVKRIVRLRHLRTAKLPLSMDQERLLAIFDTPSLYDVVSREINLVEMAGKGSPDPSSRASCADPSPIGTPARD